jgi:hypothetical protein
MTMTMMQQPKLLLPPKRLQLKLPLLEFRLSKLRLRLEPRPHLEPHPQEKAGHCPSWQLPTPKSALVKPPLWCSEPW